MQLISTSLLLVIEEDLGQLQTADEPLEANRSCTTSGVHAYH